MVVVIVGGGNVKDDGSVVVKVVTVVEWGNAEAVISSNKFIAI